MSPRLIPFLLIMSLLSLLGCSGTSQDLPASLSELRAEIRIEDHTSLTSGSGHARKSIRAVLRNSRGAALERGDVTIEVNGVPMEFHVGRGNYYDRHPYYTLDDDQRAPVLPATEYRFTFVLPDGVRHEIGTVRTPAALSAKQIEFPEKRPASGAVTIAWREVAEPTTLALYRSDMRREPDGTTVLEGSTGSSPDALRRTIGPGWFRSRSDQWVVPEKFLASDTTRTLRSLGADFLVVNEGRMSGTFSKQSTLQAERKLTLNMEFVKLD